MTFFCCTSPALAHLCCTFFKLPLWQHFQWCISESCVPFFNLTKVLGCTVCHPLYLLVSFLNAYYNNCFSAAYFLLRAELCASVNYICTFFLRWFQTPSLSFALFIVALSMVLGVGLYLQRLSCYAKIWGPLQDINCRFDAEWAAAMLGVQAVWDWGYVVLSRWSFFIKDPFKKKFPHKNIDGTECQKSQ